MSIINMFFYFRDFFYRKGIAVYRRLENNPFHPDVAEHQAEAVKTLRAFVRNYKEEDWFGILQAVDPLLEHVCRSWRPWWLIQWDFERAFEDLDRYADWMFDPGAPLINLDTPSLWLFAEEDRILPYCSNLEALSRIQGLHQAPVQWKVYPEVGHTMVYQKLEDYGREKGAGVPELIPDILDWLKEQNGL